MNLVLLCVCSVLGARYLEKRMKVASIAHSVLFIVMAFFFLFDSGFALVDQAMINVFGEYSFNVIHDALTEASSFYQNTMSVLMMMEIVVLMMSGVVAVVLLIKSIKKIIEKTKLVFHYVEFHQKEETGLSSFEYEHSAQNTYLVLAHLRN